MFIIAETVIRTVSSGIQSDWDLEATLVGGVIGGASAAAGYGTFGPASAAFASLGDIGAGIAGGAVAGAVAGGTSGILTNMAGYRVNIGLAIASGAAAGGITGGAYGRWGQLGAFAAAPAAGASGAAISGADPGMGAAIAAATAAFALGAQELATRLAPAQMSGGQVGSSGNRMSMNDVADALDVISDSITDHNTNLGFPAKTRQVGFVAPGGSYEDARYYTPGVGGVLGAARSAWGTIARDFSKFLRTGEGAWTLRSSTAEMAQGLRYKGGISIQDLWVNEQAGVRLYHHQIYRDGKLLHETFRPYGK